MTGRWISEEAWLGAISVKRVAIQRHTQPGHLISYQGPNPEAVEEKRQRNLHRLRASLKRVITAGEHEWQERLDAPRT